MNQRPHIAHRLAGSHEVVMMIEVKVAVMVMVMVMVMMLEVMVMVMMMMMNLMVMVVCLHQERCTSQWPCKRTPLQH